MYRLLFNAFLMVLLSFTGPGLWAQENGLGRLGQYLPPTGRDGPWQFTNTGSTFEINNSADSGSIRYYYVAPQGNEEGRRVIEASISIHPDSAGSAGLLYGLSRDAGYYHVLGLQADGLVTLFRRDGDGFRPMMESSKPDVFLPGKANRLRIEESADAITFWLNGVKLGEVGGDLYGHGAVGVAAVGAVRAFYNGFSIGTGDQSGLEQDDQTAVLQSGDAAKQALYLRPVTIADNAAPFGAMPAFYTFIPKDWEAEGGVQWNPANGCHTGPGVHWSASSADKQFAFSILPPLKWTANNFGAPSTGCLNLDLPDAESALRGYLQSTGVEVEVLGAERPEELRPLFETVRAGKIPLNLPYTTEWDDWIVLHTRGTYEGVTTDNAIIAVTSHFEQSQVDALNRTLVARGGNTAFLMIVATPAGSLKEGHPAFPAILGNMRPNPAWQKAVARWAQQMAAQRNASRPTSSMSSSGTSVSDMMFDSWRRRNAMSDAGHSSTINSIMEVQPFQSSSGPVLLSQDYNTAWELDDGSIVMTNDYNFNPMEHYNQTGQQMEILN